MPAPGGPAAASSPPAPRSRSSSAPSSGRGPCRGPVRARIGRSATEDGAQLLDALSRLAAHRFGSFAERPRPCSISSWGAAPDGEARPRPGRLGRRRVPGGRCARQAGARGHDAGARPASPTRRRRSRSCSTASLAALGPGPWRGPARLGRRPHRRAPARVGAGGTAPPRALAQLLLRGRTAALLRVGERLHPRRAPPPG